MTAGRPKIKLKDLRKDWKKYVIEEMELGASLCEIQAGLDISEKTFNRLCKENMEFLRTIKKGKRLSKAWWFNHGRKNLDNVKFNTPLYSLNMMNRHGWNKKKDYTTNGKDLVPKIEISEKTSDKYK